MTEAACQAKGADIRSMQGDWMPCCNWTQGRTSGEGGWSLICFSNSSNCKGVLVLLMHYQPKPLLAKIYLFISEIYPLLSYLPCWSWKINLNYFMA